MHTYTHTYIRTYVHTYIFSCHLFTLFCWAPSFGILSFLAVATVASHGCAIAHTPSPTSLPSIFTSRAQNASHRRWGPSPPQKRRTLYIIVREPILPSSTRCMWGQWLPMGLPSLTPLPPPESSTPTVTEAKPQRWGQGSRLRLRLKAKAKER